MAVQKVPEGAHTVVAHLVLSDASSAIEFYKRAFGAVEVSRLAAPDGSGALWHAAIRIGDSEIFLADEAVSMGNRSPQSLGGSPVTLHLNVEDCDALFRKATEAGAKAQMPPQDMFWGDRYGVVTDPYGFTWSMGTHVRDLSDEEIKRGAQQAAAEYQAQQAAQQQAQPH